MTVYFNKLEINRPQFLGGGKWILENLNEINIIFGRNGSGKSILLRTLLNQDRKNFYYVSPERSGNINFRPDLMQQQFDAESRLSQRNRNQNPSYREEVVARIQTYLAARGSISSNSIPLPKEEIEEIISNLLPNFEFKIKKGSIPYEMKRLENNEIIHNIDVLSSGEAEVLSLGLDLITICAMWTLENQENQEKQEKQEKQEERLLLIDSPDPHLHPELQQHLAKFLVDLSDKFKVQLIIATHSTTMLSALGQYGSNKTSVIYLNNETENQKAVQFNDYLRELTTCLGGHALMGPLFSYPLLLVEGDDDYKIWSYAARYNKLRIAVIPCNGDEIEKYAKTLEKLFKALIENPAKPLAYKLRDRDDRIVSNDIQKIDKNYVKGVRLKCRESENLYLSNEVLQIIEITQEEAYKKINEEADKYGLKAGKLKSITTAKKEDIDLKGLMEELVEIIDPKKVDWRIRIAQCLGRNKPDGEIKEFLGEDLISYLWI